MVLLDGWECCGCRVVVRKRKNWSVVCSILVGGGKGSDYCL